MRAKSNRTGVSFMKALAEWVRKLCRKEKKHKRRQCLCARAKITDREKTKQNAFRIGGCVCEFYIFNINCAFHRSSLPLIDAWSGCAKSVRSQLPLLVFLSLRPFPIKTHLWVAPFGAAGDALAAAAGNLFFYSIKAALLTFARLNFFCHIRRLFLPAWYRNSNLY